jgi:hypothetical protein
MEVSMEQIAEQSGGGDREPEYRGEDTKVCVCPVCGSASRPRGIRFYEGLVVVNGASVRLTRTEGSLFERLLKAFPGLVRKDRLYHEIISAKFTAADWPDEKIVSVYIHHLRRKLQKVGLKIETSHLYGYRLVRRKKAVAEAAE